MSSLADCSGSTRDAAVSDRQALRASGHLGICKAAPLVYGQMQTVATGSSSQSLPWECVPAGRSAMFSFVRRTNSMNGKGRAPYKRRRVITEGSIVEHLQVSKVCYRRPKHSDNPSCIPGRTRCLQDHPQLPGASEADQRESTTGLLDSECEVSMRYEAIDTMGTDTDYGCQIVLPVWCNRRYLSAPLRKSSR